MYKICKDFILQRHYSVEPTIFIICLRRKKINFNEPIDTEKNYYVLANKNIFYEVNIIGGLILEEIIFDSSSDCEKIAKKIHNITLGISLEEITTDVKQYISFLQHENIIE